MDAKYDVAASTAAAALDFICVDDTPAAQRCVELLRRRGLGVATFLMLDKQAHLAQRAAQKARPPEGAPRRSNTLAKSRLLLQHLCWQPVKFVKRDSEDHTSWSNGC